MSDWVWWVIAAAVLSGAETMSMSLVLVMFAGGSAAAALTAATGGPVALQFAVAIVVSLALLAGVRPFARRHLLAGPPVVTGSDALVGAQAIVVSQVDIRDGRVRLNGGEWSARSFDAGQVLPAGTVVRVVKISGATAVVLQDDPYLTTGGLR